MSDSDDSDILADIEALDRVLTTSQETVQYPSSSKVQFDNVDSIEVDSKIESDDEFADFIQQNQDIDISSLNALELNIKLSTGLIIVKNKFAAMMQQCEEKIKQLNQELENNNKESNRRVKLPISQAGMPYFKDKDYFYVPKNFDTLLKEARGELFIVYLQKPNRWSDKDREILLSAVHNEAFESVLSGGFDGQVDKKFKHKGNNQAEKNKLVLPRNFNEMVGAVGEREFDWLKISNMDFDNKHSAGECRAMWNVYLHPDIRKTEWTVAEDAKLLKCAKLCKYQDWDTITQKLRTNRSAYQCFIRYNTIKKVPSSGRAWTMQEDKHLLRVIKTLRIGNYIPWFEVANYLRHRTKQQIYTRWMYRKAPHLKKGRFTLAESEQLLQAVEKYGKDFRKIANVAMPNRTTPQLLSRYKTIIAQKYGRNLWTIDTDMRLIQLHKRYGNDWSKIARYFSNKTRTQLRHRFTAILKFVQRGVSVNNIPRIASKMRYKKSEYSIASECSKKALVEQLYETAKYHTYYVDINDIEPRLYEILLFPLSLESVTEEEPYDFKSLARDTRKLYNTLELLDAKLDIPVDDLILNDIRLNKRDKELLISLKEYINIRNNKLQNNKVIEEFRMRMFGPEPTVSETSRFIPPLPFNGYVKKTRKTRKKDRVIDCNLEINKHLIDDVPVEFSSCTLTWSFLSFEERIQFDKFSQLFITDYYYEKPNVNLHNKSLQCNSSFDKSRRSSRRNRSNTNSKVSSTSCTQVRRSNLQETISTECNENNEENMWDNIILPNNATLLGWKNLLLWKLLYEYQNESKLIDESEVELEESEVAEYQLLRTRLLKLFKFPIGLSNTIVEITEPDTVFLTKEEQHSIHENISRKRKSKDVTPDVSKRKR